MRKGEAYDFSGVDLLTLSACETALDSAGAGGKEIEGLGTLAQKKGAGGVLATLWPVADSSTGLFMQRLYRLREEQGLSKAEALRRAQLSFLHDESANDDEMSRQRGKVVSLNGAKGQHVASTGYRHPYYWAPFILMGNWL
jgi:CHAT domain-containing protein